MKLKKKDGGGGANWMDTYGDMVTLLLCFFVLLYSMSTISEEKWRAIVQSFNPNASRIVTETPGGEGPNADSDEGQGGPMVVDPAQQSMTPEEAQAMMASQQEEINEALEKLYEQLKEYTEANQAGQTIEVTKGDGYVFVSFNDAVFFDGDSYQLRSDGEQVLTSVAQMLSQAKDYIDEVRVMGHTAQALDNQPNDAYKDRMLSAQRAAAASWYLQVHSDIDPARVVSVGYGQHRPVAPNVAGTRYKNRRVELMVTGKDLFSELGDNIEQYYSIRAGGANLLTTPSPLPEESAAPAQSPAP